MFTNPIMYWGLHVTTARRYDTRQTLGLLTNAKVGIIHPCGVLQIYEWMVAEKQFSKISFPALHTLFCSEVGDQRRAELIGASVTGGFACSWVMVQQSWARWVQFSRSETIRLPRMTLRERYCRSVRSA